MAVEARSWTFWRLDFQSIRPNQSSKSCGKIWRFLESTLCLSSLRLASGLPLSYAPSIFQICLPLHNLKRCTNSQQCYTLYKKAVQTCVSYIWLLACQTIFDLFQSQEDVDKQSIRSLQESSLAAFSKVVTLYWAPEIWWSAHQPLQCY